MIAPPRWRRPVAAGRQVERERYGNRDPILPHRPSPVQVNRLRLAARCLALSPAFVNDAPLTAELYDARGRLTELWIW